MTDQVAVHPRILAAINGTWVPSAHARKCRAAALAVKLGVTPWVAGRVMLARRSWETAVLGRAECLAGAANDQPGRVVRGRELIREAADYAMAALEPESLATDDGTDPAAEVV